MAWLATIVIRINNYVCSNLLFSDQYPLISVPVTTVLHATILYVGTILTCSISFLAARITDWSIIIGRFWNYRTHSFLSSKYSPL